MSWKTLGNGPQRKFRTEGDKRANQILEVSAPGAQIATLQS